MKMINRLLLLPLILSLQACSTYYSAEPITARVIDAETNQPIEGVVIVAHWQLEGGLEGGTNLGQMMVMEATTDATGKFSFPAWGPKKVPSDYPWYYSNARLKNMDPEMLFFKSGYQYLKLANPWQQEFSGGKESYIRTSQWNGKTIKMESLGGDLQKEFQSAEDFSFSLGFTDNSFSPCVWTDIPKTIAMLIRLNAILRNWEAYRRFLISWHQMKNNLLLKDAVRLMIF